MPKIFLCNDCYIYKIEEDYISYVECEYCNSKMVYSQYIDCENCENEECNEKCKYIGGEYVPYKEIFF